MRECGTCRRMLWSLAETVRVLGTLRARDSSADAERMVAAIAPRLKVRDDPRDERPGNDRRTQLRAAVRYCLQRPQLHFTVPIGLAVGASLSLANKGARLLEGQIDLGMCAVCALDFLLPFVAMNVVLLSVTRLVGRS